MLVYFHRNPITYEIFYVGIGTKQGRAYDCKGRNKFWHNYTRKYGLPVVQIVQPDVTKDMAFYWEKYYIKLLGKRAEGGSLVNITNGGESRPSDEPEILNRIVTSLKSYYDNNPEAKEKRKADLKKHRDCPNFQKKRKEKFEDYMNSPRFKEKSISALTNWIKNNPDKNPMKRKESVDKLRGDNNSSKRPEVRAKLRVANLGKKASDETRLKQSLLKKGKPSNQPKGYKHSPEVIERLKIINKENAIKRKLMLLHKLSSHPNEPVYSNE